MVLFAVCLDVGCVAHGLEPRPADLFDRPAGCAALLHQGAETGLNRVVERDLLEADLARLPEGVIVALSLLHGFELGNESFVAGCDVLVPALLDVLPLQLLHKVGLCNAQ